MGQVGLRGALLATTSVLALVIGGGQAAEAQCAFNNVAPVDNTGSINCISFNSGVSSTGNVTNEASGVITATHPYPPVNAGTSTGISVVGAGTKLTGDITNNGSISAPQYGINIGAGAHGIPPTLVGIGATLVGSITNNGTITGGGGGGIVVRQSTVTGSITNAAGATINTVNVGIVVTGVSGNLATVGGSVTNNGSIIVNNNDGMFVQFAKVGGSFVNSGTITTGTQGSAGMVASSGSIAGSVINSGSITAKVVGIDILGEVVGGSVSNTGTINAQFGIAVTGLTGLPAIITGNVINSGTINASAHTGIAIFGSTGGATIGGSILNSGTINAPLGTGIGVFGATVGGSIVNSGKITAKGVGIYVSSSSTAGATSIKGGVSNQGSITAKTGIAVGGGSTVAGGITNTGNITGTRAAIDLATLFGGEGAATVINQQAGTITGDILLSSLGDTVNVTGGAIAGNIIGTGSSGTVNFALGAGNSFTYSNAITGVQAVNVNSGTLFDNNSITATTVNVNGGTLAPGQPGAVGTLTITGSLAFSNLATYLVTLSPPAASRTNVTGPASVAGTVKVAALPGPYVFGTTYTILTATTGVTGTFGGVTSSSSVTGKLSYDAHDVFLTVAPNLLTPLLPPGSPTNVLNVAGAIDNFNISNGGVFPSGFQTLFGLTPQQLSNALTQLSGELGTGAPLSAFELMTAFMSLLTGPFAGGHGVGTASGFAPDRAQAFPPEIADAYASVLKAPPAPAPYGRYNVWGAAYGGTNNTSGDPTVGSHDVTARAGGFTGGVDYRISPDTVVGFALAGGATTWGLSAGLGSGRSDAFQAGLYGRQEFGAAYFSGALAFANYWASTTRTVTVAGFDTLSASFNAQSFGGRAEAGYWVAYAPFTLTPYAALQAQSFSLPSYSETAASGSSQFALAYNANTATAVRAELGSWISKTMVLADASALAMFGRAAWAHDWDNSLALTPTFLGLPTASFVVNGAKPPANLALLTAGAELRMRNGWSVMGRFDGEFAQGSQTYTGTARVRYTW